MIILSFTAGAQSMGQLKNSGTAYSCGNLRFTAPVGWTVTKEGENYALGLPPRNMDSERWINMAIIKGSMSDEHIENYFNRTWQKYLGAYTKYQEPYLIREKSIKGYDIIRGGTNVRKGNEMPIYAHLWIANVGDRLENIIVFANNKNDFDIAVNTELRPFWAKLQFKNLPEKSSEYHTLSGHGIQGLYTGLQSGMRKSGGIARNISFLIIYEDGKIKIANKLPENGFHQFDREVDREMNASYWGEYDAEKEIVVFDKFSQPRTLGFAYQPPKVIYNEYAYTKMPSVDRLTLSGTYSADNSPTAITAFGHEPTITFYKNGGFEDNTALYYVKSDDPMFKKPGKGKYNITNFTIDLVYDDGRGSASFPLVTWDAAANSSIQIGENILLKK